MSYVACPAPQYFSTLSHKRRDFWKKVFSTKCLSSFSKIFLWNIFHSGKKWARYDQKRILVFIQSNLYSCPILVKLEFSQQIFEKYANIKFHENPLSGSRVVPCGQTDMTKLIISFRIFAKGPKSRQRTHSTQLSRTHTANRSKTRQATRHNHRNLHRLTDRRGHQKTTRRWINSTYWR